MAFRFPLETLFRLRKSMERQEQLRLSEASQTVLRLRNRLRQLDEVYCETQRALRRDLEEASLAAALHLGVAAEAGYADARKVLLAQLAEAEERREACLAEYLAARREREILASLRARHREAYDREARRRHQQRVDELFLLRGISRTPETTLPGE